MSDTVRHYLYNHTNSHPHSLDGLPVGATPFVVASLRCRTQGSAKAR